MSESAAGFITQGWDAGAMMKKIIIIDVVPCNHYSLRKAFSIFSNAVYFSSEVGDAFDGDLLVLPGVSSLNQSMCNLEQFGLVDKIKDFIESGKQFLGICAGMQALFDYTKEHGGKEGLGILKGSVEPISDYSKDEKTPHIGWDPLVLRRKRFDIDENSKFYFAHSYMACSYSDEYLVASYQLGGIAIPAIFNKDNVFGLQFHPELSGKAGLNILEQIVSAQICELNSQN